MGSNDAVQTESVEEAYYSFQADESHVECRAVAGGQVVVASRKAPQKESVNEDAAAIIPLGEDRGVLLVADGLGGHASGELASRMTVELIGQAVRQRAEENGETLDAEQLRFAILSGIEIANKSILELGSGAGTTLCVAEIQGDSFRVYHIGDSAVLLVGQRGKLKMQTMAHSPIGYAVEAGLLNESDAMHHEERHLISNVIGSEEMRIEIGPTRRISRRDTLLLTSDGLLDNLLTEEIVERIRKGPLEKAVKQLVEEAWTRMERGPNDRHPSKPDDLTLVAFRRGG